MCHIPLLDMLTAFSFESLNGSLIIISYVKSYQQFFMDEMTENMWPVSVNSVAMAG